MNNQFFTIVLNSDLSLSVTEKKYNKNYYCPNPFMLNYGNEYSYDLARCCEHEITETADCLNIRFFNIKFYGRFPGNEYCKPDPGPDLQFEFSIVLDDDHIVFKTEKINGMNNEECKINFPNGLMAFKADKEAQLLLPLGYGSMLPFPNQDNYDIKYQTNYHYNCLPLIGYFSPQGGLFAYNKTPFDLVTSIKVNCDKNDFASVEFTQVFEKQNANYPREMHIYALKPDDNYVDLAKMYRNIVKKEGRFVSLKQKIEENPEVEKLVGSVIWKHQVYSAARPKGVEKSYSYFMMHPEQNQYEGLPSNWTAKEVFDTAHKKGFDRVCVYNAGWNRDGYDAGFPLRLPPNDERGTVEEFSKAADYARSLSDDYIYSVHDNYIDVYENSEEFDKEELLSDSNGVPTKGGIWRGGRAYMLCGHEQMKYAKRDIPQIVKMLGKGSIYVDVIGLYPFQSCHHPEHCMTKREDAQLRRELMKYIKKEVGSLALEGAPSDYFADIADLGAYCSIFINHIKPACKKIPVPVPFWQLVYHDSVLNYTCESAYKVYGSEYLLYVALYGMLPTQLDDAGKRLSLGLRSAYTAEMTNHEFIEAVSINFNKDGSFHTSGVAKTSFSDGTEVLANFNNKEYNYHGKIIPARDYIINGETK